MGHHKPESNGNEGVLHIPQIPRLEPHYQMQFSQTVAVSILLYRCIPWMLIKPIEKRLDENYTRMLQAILNKSWKQHPTKTVAVQPSTYHLTNHSIKMNKMCWTQLEKQEQTHVTFSFGFLHIDVLVLADQQRHQHCTATCLYSHKPFK